MSYDYGKYASGTDSTTSGNDNGENDGYSKQKTVTIVPNAAIEGDLMKVFGTKGKFGQSLGLSWENVELVDGCLYHDTEKDRFKIFSWKDVVGISPEDAEDLTADQANEYLVKTYGTTEKRYKLVEAVVPDKDDPAEIGDVIMWYGGSEEYGPKSASKTLARLLTVKGRDMVIAPEDSTTGKYIDGWLADSSGEDVLRPDLQNRRFAFFMVKREANNTGRFFHFPIVVDTATGVKVQIQNGTEPTALSTFEDDSDDEAAENEADTPEPIADFISTCDSLGFNDRDRAATLLADLVADDGNDLTAKMIEDFGGEDTVLDEVAA